MALDKRHSRHRRPFATGLCLAANLVLWGTAGADCVSWTTQAGPCENLALALDGSETLPQPGLGFSLALDTGPISYPAEVEDGFAWRTGELSFEVPQALPEPSTASPGSRVEAVGQSEPAFALLFGSLARLMSDGSMALGRGLHQARLGGGQKSLRDLMLPGSLGIGKLPFDMDMDLGLRYATDGGFSTSLGYVDRLGEENMDHAIVGWFEFRF